MMNLPGVRRPDTNEPNAAPVITTWLFVSLLAAHAYLGVFLKANGAFATVFALLVGIVALALAMWDKSPERTFLMMGYIVGSEILWRMTRADIFWMYAEYLVMVLSVVSILRHRPAVPGIRSSLLYVVPLLLSVPMMLGTMPFDMIRKGLAFNLAGPVAFGLSVYAASRLVIGRSWLPLIAFTAVLPIISVAVLGSIRLAAGGVVFGTQSNVAAAGGYAPNQVSTLMSYGAAILFTLIIMQNSWTRYKAVFIILMVYLSAQGILTFSRGGLLNTLAFLMFFLPFLLRDKKTRLRLIGLAIILIPLLNFFIAPEIESLTGGALERRYSTTGNSTGRTRIMEEELEIFQTNTFFGVGPGMSAHNRLQQFGTFHAVSHTEYTRLLAEHGLVGVVAFLFFLATYKAMYSRSKYPRAQGFVLATLAWSLTMFVHAATRTLTFGFLTVLAVLWVQAVDDGEERVHDAGS